MIRNDALALLGGVLLAGIGGELFVRGLVGVARWLRVPPGIIGATLAAFATSSPELAVAISSASDGHPEISLGDALGSNVVNIALILALGLLLRPVQCERSTIRREFPAALLVPIVIGIMGLDHVLGRLDAAVLVTLFAAWLVAVIREARGRRDPTAEVIGRRIAVLAAGSCLGGLLALFAGGRLIVVGAEGMARAWGLPEFVIGATVVAAGTSVPELATVVISQLRGHQEVGLGVVLGSNIFNGLFIVAVAAGIHPIATTAPEVTTALFAGLATVAMTFPPPDGRVGRGRGALLLAAYVAYVLVVLLH